MNLNKLFRPKTLAVVGGYWADFVFEGTQKLGFKGQIWHINLIEKAIVKKNIIKMFVTYRVFQIVFISPYQETLQ